VTRLKASAFHEKEVTNRPDVHVCNHQSLTYRGPDAAPPRPVDICYYTLLGGANRSFFALWRDTRNWDEWIAARIGDIYGSEVEVCVPVPPDFQPDCDVDLTDFALFAQCYGGPDNPPSPNCPPGVDADLDHDGDVDLNDFAIFSELFTGALDLCGGECGAQMGAGGEGGAGMDGQAGISIPSDPVIQELYWMLYRHCREKGIPFT
jgi:hypothetical protein